MEGAALLRKDLGRRVDYFLVKDKAVSGSTHTASNTNKMHQNSFSTNVITNLATIATLTHTGVLIKIHSKT